MPATKRQPTSRQTRKSLSAPQRDALLEALQARFEKHPQRHGAITWRVVQERLDANPDALWSLHEMERTGGEPDVVGRDKSSGAILFMDCSAQTPAGRRSVCYDPEALESRKAHKPKHSAVGMAAEMGVALLSEAQYRELQTLGAFDTTTSSWIETPREIRKLGGALFGDRRYNQVFTYHNGAESYYAARGFRVCLRV